MAFHCCELMHICFPSFPLSSCLSFLPLFSSFPSSRRSGFPHSPSTPFSPSCLSPILCFPISPLAHPPSLLCRGDATDSLRLELAHADPSTANRRTSLASLLWGEHGAAKDACGGTEDSCLDIRGGRGRDMLGQRPLSRHNTPCTETSVANHGNSLEASHMDCHLHRGSVQLPR